MHGNPEDEALNRILGDMDSMESGRMFGGGADKGVSITISVVPNGEEEEEGEYPEGHDIGMCKGGCAQHMAKGGVVAPASVESPEEGEKELPPFLRKKKKPLQST